MTEFQNEINKFVYGHRQDFPLDPNVDFSAQELEEIKEYILSAKKAIEVIKCHSIL